jgi:hypothetical protein
MKIVYYDHAFNQNEWFVISVIIIVHFIMFLLPKRFPLFLSIIMYLFGFTTGVMFDNTIGAHIFDLYDISDSSKYTLMDILTYIMFGPFGYLFSYVQDKYRIQGRFLIFYVLLWCFFSFGLEGLAEYFQVFHYKNGYHLYFSFPIYLVTMGLYYWLYVFMTQKREVKE